MDYNTRTGNKASQEEKRPVEEKKVEHEHHEHHVESEEKPAADTGKFGGLDDHSATTDSSAKTHSTSYTD